MSADPHRVAVEVENATKALPVVRFTAAAVERDAALARLDAVRQYVDNPGNWSALDGRRATLLALLDDVAAARAAAADPPTPGEARTEKPPQFGPCSDCGTAAGEWCPPDCPGVIEDAAPTPGGDETLRALADGWERLGRSVKEAQVGAALTYVACAIDLRAALASPEPTDDDA